MVNLVSVMAGFSIWLECLESHSVLGFLTFVVVWETVALGTIKICGWLCGTPGQEDEDECKLGEKWLEKVMVEKENRKGWSRKRMRRVWDSILGRGSAALRAVSAFISSDSTMVDGQMKEQQGEGSKEENSNTDHLSPDFYSGESTSKPASSTTLESLLEVYNHRRSSLEPHGHNRPYPTPIANSFGFYKVPEGDGDADPAAQATMISLETQLFFLHAYDLAFKFVLADYSFRLVLSPGNAREKVEALKTFLEEKDLGRWRQGLLRSRSGKETVEDQGLENLWEVKGIRAGVVELIDRCGEFFDWDE